MPFENLLHGTLLWIVMQKLSCRSPNAVWAQNRSEILKDPKIYYTTTELACADGYPVQEHKIVTDEGYILTVHRIPNGQTRAKVPTSQHHYHKIHRRHHPDFDRCIRESQNATATGLPVLFVHGLLMASDGWLLQGPGFDLVYLMADEGFDVWMANVRGNFYSRQHRTMRASDPKFWDFSFHENAMHDIPSIIDYILKVTEKEKIGYLGYSMGSTIFFSMASLLPEYQDKIMGFAALAPVAFIKKDNMNYRRRTLFNVLFGILDDLRKKGHVHELFPRSNTLLRLGMNYCSKGSRLQDLCYEFVALYVGYRSRMVLRNKFHLYVTHLPTGTSLKTLMHYEQNVHGNQFRQFDYGNATNVEVYGTDTPPDYPLWNITVPVALYYTKDDFFYDVRDIDELRRYLPNVMEVDEVEKFNHADYLWSYRAKNLVYRKVISAFHRFQDQYERNRLNEP